MQFLVWPILDFQDFFLASLRPMYQIASCSKKGILAVTSKLGLTHRIMILCLGKTLLLCEQSDAIFTHSIITNDRRKSQIKIVITLQRFGCCVVIWVPED